MASATYTDLTSSYANFRLVLSLSSTANVSNNTSTVSYDCYIDVVAAPSNYRANNNNSAYFAINGTVLVNTANIGSIWLTNAPVGTRAVTIASGSITVDHGSDGTKSIAYSASFRNTSLWGEALALSGNFTLDNIPRTSKVSVSSSTVTAGSAVTINTNRASSSFTHTLQYKIGSGSYTNIATGVGASYSWTTPTSIANAVPSANSATVTINCITYSGSTQIGTSTVSITVNVPSYTIAAPGMTVSDGNNVLSGFYLQGLSTIKVVLSNPAMNYGASVKGYSIKITPPSGSALSYTTSSATTGVVSIVGTWSISATVTDTRGKTSTARTASITVTAYTQPTISGVGLDRTDTSGTSKYDGNSMKLTFTYNVKSIKSGSTEYNTCSARWQYKASTASSYGSATTVGSTVGAATTYSAVVASGALNAETAYNVLITVSDRFRSITYIVNLSAAAIPIDLNESGTAMGLFSPANVSNAIHVGKDLVVDADKAISCKGTNATYPIIKFKDNTSDQWGNGVVIGGGGLVVVGAGESSDTVAAQYSAGAEELALASDGIISFYTNANNGISSAKKTTIDSNGLFSGTAATAAKANSIYGLNAFTSSMGWGNQTGTVLNCCSSPAGGGWGFRDNNPVSGQMSMIIDGTVYVNEGQNRVIATGGSVNTNTGGYIRFVDQRIQIAWKQVTWKGKITNAWGSSIYESTAQINIGNWPAAFSATPAVAYSAHSSGNLTGWVAQAGTPPSASAAGAIYIERGGTTGAEQTWTVKAIGIGPY